MKKLFLGFISIAAVLTISSCSKEERVKQRPDDIISTTVKAEVYQQIMAQFPENQNVKTKQQALFETTAEKHIVLLNESEIYVTFIAEGAGYQNSFGWYSYNENSKPTKASDLELNLLFPTVNGSILKQGDMLQLGNGKFPAGTVIGFFLIIRGWENGTVHYDRQTFYTDMSLNQDGQQQHVLFKQKDLGELVLSFEDELTSGVSDKDFNDIIFTVTDNKAARAASNFDLTHVTQL